MRRLLDDAGGGEHIPRQAADAGFAVLHRVLRKLHGNGSGIGSIEGADDATAGPEEIALTFDIDPPRLPDEPDEGGPDSDSDDEDDPDVAEDAGFQEDEAMLSSTLGEPESDEQSEAEDFEGRACRGAVHRPTRGLRPSDAQAAAATPLFADVGLQVIQQAALPRADRAARATAIRTRAAGGPQRLEQFTTATLLVVGAPCEVAWEDGVWHDFQGGDWMVFTRMRPFIVQRADGVAYYVIAWRDFVTRSEVALFPSPAPRQEFSDTGDELEGDSMMVGEVE
jgi:hypothetical protein